VIDWLKPLYDYAWFVGFGASFGVYVALMERLPAATGLARSRNQ
jgi:cytosine/uracil/thiamine/allantoin permease